MTKRYADIDFVRGLALIGMIVYHLFYDLVFFGNLKALPEIIKLSGPAIATTFLFLVGLGFALSENKYRATDFYPRQAKHISLITLSAFLVTISTYFATRDYFVRFGILHLIALSLLVLLLLHRLPKLVIFILSISLLIFSFYYPIRPNFITFDFYPPLPWLALPLLGYSVSEQYLLLRRKFDPKLSPLFNPIVHLGRHTLLIYLIHQPIILGLLFLKGQGG